MTSLNLTSAKHLPVGVAKGGGEASHVIAQMVSPSQVDWLSSRRRGRGEEGDNGENLSRVE
jgi:hypothetical protein